MVEPVLKSNLSCDQNLASLPQAGTACGNDARLVFYDTDASHRPFLYTLLPKLQRLCCRTKEPASEISIIRSKTYWPLRRLVHAHTSKLLREDSPSLTTGGPTALGCRCMDPDSLNSIHLNMWNNVQSEYYGDFALDFPSREGAPAQQLKGIAVVTMGAYGTEAKVPAKNEKPGTNFNNGQPVVVFLSGWGRPAEQIAGPFATYYATKHKANFMALNYRGFGKSTDGVPSHRSMVEDGILMINHLLVQGVLPENILLHGYSMGANIAANVMQAAEAANVKLGGLVLDRPMNSLASGAAALAKVNFTWSISKMIMPRVISLLAWAFLQPMNTRQTLSKLRSHDAEIQNRIVGIYDTDPIGLTSLDLLESSKIENPLPVKGDHGAHEEACNTLNTALPIRRKRYRTHVPESLMRPLHGDKGRLGNQDNMAIVDRCTDAIKRLVMLLNVSPVHLVLVKEGKTAKVKELLENAARNFDDSERERRGFTAEGIDDYISRLEFCDRRIQGLLTPVMTKGGFWKDSYEKYRGFMSLNLHELNNIISNIEADPEFEIQAGKAVFRNSKRRSANIRKVRTV